MGNQPIRRNENIVKLSQDHHASLMFCWKIRQGVKQHVATPKMVKYIQYFLSQHFKPHFQEEEEILFAPLQNDEKVQHALSEHVLILETVNEILSSDKVSQQEELSGLADIVDAHVRYEERILFPYLEKELSEEQLQKIGEQISDHPIKDHYEDEFWVKSKSL